MRGGSARCCANQQRVDSSYRARMRQVALVAVVVVAALPAATTAGTHSRVPNWALQLRVSRWVAPSSFAGTVTGQTAGPKVRHGLPVTLVLDRRTRCLSRNAAGAVASIRCAEVRPTLAARGTLAANASGQFETGHRGAIGFRARILTVLH